MSEFSPELGQAVFGDTPWSNTPTPAYITAGFEIIAAAIQDASGIDPAECWPLTANSGAEPWEGEVFAMRCYCWCDGGREGHEDGCPPNFEHKSSGFTATWYKHSERGESCSSPVPSAAEWSRIVAECVAEVAA